MGQIISACLDSGQQQSAQAPAQQAAGQPYRAAARQSQCLFFPDGELPCRNMLNTGVRRLTLTQTKVRAWDLPRV
jgi:hypothetical protein